MSLPCPTFHEQSFCDVMSACSALSDSLAAVKRSLKKSSWFITTINDRLLASNCRFYLSILTHNLAVMHARLMHVFVAICHFSSFSNLCHLIKVFDI